MDKRAATAQLSDLLTQVLASQEAERRAVMEVLQEDIGQALAALALHLRITGRTCNNPEHTVALDKARAMTIEILHEVEGLIHELCPPALESQGLVPALEVYAKEFAKSAHIHVELDTEVLHERLPPELALAMFRIVQDALENVQDHAYATIVQVRLRRVDNYVYLMIQDNGVGYTPEALSDWGFLRMKQRVASLNGCSIFSAIPGEGARVEFTIPIKCEDD